MKNKTEIELPLDSDFENVFLFFRDQIAEEHPDFDCERLDTMAARQVIEHAKAISEREAQNIENDLKYRASQITTCVLLFGSEPTSLNW